MLEETVNSDKTILVGDIGGTNARLAIATLSTDSSTPRIQDFRAYPNSEYHDMSQVIKQYQIDFPNHKPTCACLAVAGPIFDGTAHLTNLGWHLDEGKLQQEFGFGDVKLVNDFAALARSVTALENNDLVTLTNGNNAPDSPIAIMGPGTGFGLALLVRHAAGVTVVPTEGGHISFVPQGEREQAVWENLQNSLERVTVETMLSGVGLMRIYRELCHISHVSPLNYEPSTISQLAMDGEDELCMETLTIFCGIMGSVAGDLALALGAKGGVFIGGGILPKVSDFFTNSHFLKRFLHKPPMSHFVADIPVNLITAPDAALKGAALMFDQ